MKPKMFGNFNCLLIIVIILIASCNAAVGRKVTNSSSDKCVVQINGTQVIKNIGDTWNSTDPCLKFTCDHDNDGVPHEKPIQQNCLVTCHNEYELLIPEGQCCGTCVRTKCKFYDKIYSVGDLWKSHDKCTFYECISQENSSVISAYKKSCPKISTNCSPGNIYIEDCCPVCKRPIPLAVGANDKNEKDGSDVLEIDTYENHPCNRECTENDEPMICKYTFLVEWYQTLSKACYDCPFNLTDCSRPHCIVGDGIRRSVLVINRMMPGPAIRVCLNDTIVVDVKNQLLGEGTTIHWHGLHQKENPYMDGVPHISQCPIAPNGMFRYAFKADNPGTHFYHSHIGMQRGDGALGSLIVRKPISLEKNAEYYDFDIPNEHTLVVQDWGHLPGSSMFSFHHHSFGNNKPRNILINGRGRYFAKEENGLFLDIPQTDESNTYKVIEEIETTTSLPITTTTIDLPEDVGLLHDSTDPNMRVQEEETTTIISPVEEPTTVLIKRTKRQTLLVYTEESEMIPFPVFKVSKNKRYRFRLINAEFLNCPMVLSIDDHNITVIASDGYDIEPVEVESFVNYAGERFDFVVNANQPVGNYWLRLKGLMDCGPRAYSAFQVGILRYDGAPEIHPDGEPDYNYVREGLQLNSLNKGSGFNDSITIAELKGLYPDDDNLLKEKPDYKFYVFYDFYGKDNPRYHVPDLYGYDQVDPSKGKVFTPQLNHITMKMPGLPLMPNKDKIDDSMFCNSTSLQKKGINCKDEFCECSHVLQVPLGAVVEMVLIDEGKPFDANHPFHMHGYGFRVLGMDRVNSSTTLDEIKELDEAGLLMRNLKSPPIKDTVTIPDGGYTVIRFLADNPGYWLFHCHIEFHAEVGMSLVIKVGETSQMVSAPKNFPTCSDFYPAGFEKNDDDDGNGASGLILFVPIWFLIAIYALYAIF